MFRELDLDNIFPYFTKTLITIISYDRARYNVLHSRQ